MTDIQHKLNYIFGGNSIDVIVSLMPFAEFVHYGDYQSPAFTVILEN